MRGELSKDAFVGLAAHMDKLIAAPSDNATRTWSGAALESLTAAIPEMIGGSADLTGSNNTIVKGMTVFDYPDYAGRYVHYGIREHGMAAAMNAMALPAGGSSPIPAPSFASPTTAARPSASAR